MTTPKTICALPWISMEVTPMGGYRPCCLYDESIPGYNASYGHTVDDAQKSQYMQDLRKQFLAGEKPAGCKVCWQEESVLGRMSKRKNTFIKLKDVTVDYSEDGVKPIFLDLKLGNICNLKCRICGSWSSSKWVQEDIALGNSKAKLNAIQGQWPRTTPQWWDGLSDALPFIEYMEFTGGEPFLIQEHFDLLQVLVDKGYSQKIDIHYNTNGTIWPKRGEELWKHFKRVEIAFSIDDVGDRFEYQRYGSNWDKTLSVITQAKKSNCDLQICTTFNVQNSYYWPELSNWISEIGIADVHFNILHEPPMFSLRNLPSNIKEKFTERMVAGHPTWQNKIKSVVGFMNLEGTDMLPDLLKRLALHDDYRKQKFATAHNEVWELLND